MRTASAPSSPQRLPVMSRRSPIKCRQAPSIGPVATGQPHGEGGVVAKLVEVSGEVADAGVGAFAPPSVQMGPVGLGRDLSGGSVCLPVEDRGEVTGDPDFGVGSAGLVEAVGRCPDVLGHVHEVEQDVHLDMASVGFGSDQIQLVAGAVDQDDPVAQMVPVAGFGLVKCGGDHVLGRVDEGGGEPLALCSWPRARGCSSFQGTG